MEVKKSHFWIHQLLTEAQKCSDIFYCTYPCRSQNYNDTISFFSRNLGRKSQSKVVTVAALGYEFPLEFVVLTVMTAKGACCLFYPKVQSSLHYNNINCDLFQNSTGLWCDNSILPSWARHHFWEQVWLYCYS
jgi:hypothetical protein